MESEGCGSVTGQVAGIASFVVRRSRRQFLSHLHVVDPDLVSAGRSSHTSVAPRRHFPGRYRVETIVCLFVFVFVAKEWSARQGFRALSSVLTLSVARFASLDLRQTSKSRRACGELLFLGFGS